MRRHVTTGLVLGAIAIFLVTSLAPLALGGTTVSSPSGIHPSIVHPASGSAPPNPFQTGMAASVALGARNLTTYWASIPPNASSFVGEPEFSCMDPSGNLWTSDFGSSRVMEFKTPFSSGEAASVILGQTSASGHVGNTTRSGLFGPAACAFDPKGNLWVSDYLNNRILEYTPPFTTGMDAALVLGQTSFTGGGATATTAHNLSGPAGLAFDGQGNLWVADKYNSRVLEFSPPFSTGMSAALVLGQSNFTGGAAGTSASNLTDPLDVAYGGGILWVADFLNNRVLGFSAPFTSGEGATYLLGQSSFTNATVGTGASGFAEALSVSVDARGNLWVSDLDHNRVLEFAPPFTTRENASIVIGQRDFTTYTFGRNATTLEEPVGAFVAANGALWVTDAVNNRILEYVPATYHLTFHGVGLPTTSGFSWSVSVSGTAYAGTSGNATASLENGSYAWSVPTIPGYTVTPSSGTATVNGASQTITLTATQVTYTVTFSALGLPSSSTWSVTLGTVTHTSVSNGSITFTVANGSFAYLVGNVSGFSITPTHGTVVVNGTARSVFVGFASTSSSSSSSSPFVGNGVGLLLLVVAFVVGLVVGLLVGRRRKKETPAAPAAQWTPPPPTSPTATPPPPQGGSPPPGAVG